MPESLKIGLPVLLVLFYQVSAEYCGTSETKEHSCPYPQKCCGNTCCLPPEYEHAYHSLRWSIWNMWYFWFIVIFVLTSCFGGCGYWRRRQLLLGQHRTFASLPPLGPGGGLTLRSFSARNAGRFTTGSALPLPLFANGNYLGNRPEPHVEPTGPAQGNFPAPPAYSEVVSKPNVYPPSYSKDDLPPYPGLAEATANNPNVNYADYFPGLPPYSANPQSGANNSTELNENTARNVDNITPSRNPGLTQNAVVLQSSHLSGHIGTSV